MNRLITAVIASCIALMLNAEGMWTGFTDENHISGPKLSEMDLFGKVVLIDEWGVACPACKSLMPKLEGIWKSFRDKGFVLVGSHRQSRNNETLAAFLKEMKVSFPIYQSAGIAKGEPKSHAVPFMYLVNHRGKVVWYGQSLNDGIEAAVNALGVMGAPSTLYGEVEFKKFKSLKPKLVLGQKIEPIMKKLEKMTEHKSSDISSEASQILQAIREAKGIVEEEIEIFIKANPAEAVGLIKSYLKSWPNDEKSVEFKQKLPELVKAAKEFKKNAKKK